MIKKLQKTDTDKKKGNAKLAGTVKESAQQIWLAGLGAFSKAQQEGGKVFETLVKEGLAIQRKTHAVAEEKISEATTRMSSMANEFGTKAHGQWERFGGRIESLIEDRVSKALSSLGVPSSRDLDAINARVDALTQGARAPARKAAVRRASPAKPAAARKTAAKRGRNASVVADDMALVAPRKTATKRGRKAAADTNSITPAV